LKKLSHAEVQLPTLDHGTTPVHNDPCAMTRLIGDLIVPTHAVAVGHKAADLDSWITLLGVSAVA